MSNNKLQRIHFDCQKVLPTVYDDSLSYYEQVCKLTKNLNDLENSPRLLPIPTTGDSGKSVVVNDDGTGYELSFRGGGGGTSDLLWRPTVSEDGKISWEQSSSDTPPEPVNIMGPQGPAGADGATGPAGQDGGYYTPSVTQPSDTTMQVSFTPSQAEMPSVEPVTVELPSGGSSGDLTLIQSGTLPEAVEILSFDFASNPIKEACLVIIPAENATGFKYFSINGSSVPVLSATISGMSMFLLLHLRCGELFYINAKSGVTDQGAGVNGGMNATGIMDNSQSLSNASSITSISTTHEALCSAGTQYYVWGRYT